MNRILFSYWLILKAFKCLLVCWTVYSFSTKQFLVVGTMRMFFSHIYTVQKTSRRLKKISTNANVIWQIGRGIIVFSNHVKVLNMCWTGTVLWLRKVTSNLTPKICTVNFGTEYIMLCRYLNCFVTYNAIHSVEMSVHV